MVTVGSDFGGAEAADRRIRYDLGGVFDTVITGGTVVDGTGSAPYTADVATKDGRIVEIGKVSGAARETIDADGVTTLVMGNCGVGSRRSARPTTPR